MIAVYSPNAGSRLQYTLNLIFKDVIGVSHTLITDETKFKTINTFKINYSNQNLDCDLAFIPENLLKETDIKPVELRPENWNELPVIFYRKGQIIPFDLFAATFFLASRYEEYLTHEQDIHGRFKAENSTAFKYGFLRQPIINCWCAMLKQIIQSKRPEINFEKRHFRFTPTFDIDNAWAYRHKGMLRTVGALVKDVLKGDFAKFKKRLEVINEKADDPYDTYEYLLNQLTTHKLNAIFFFLLGDYGKFDTNISPANNLLKGLIKRIANTSEVGIHPSYGSHRNKIQLIREIEQLSAIIEKPVRLSRQHFLKFQLPETYRRLIAAGISNDYSMGYASQPGFRASICVPFHFFDLQHNEETALRIHPLAYMDGTLKEYLKLKPKEAVTIILELIDEVKAVDGEFISLWHNDTVSDDSDWKGWRQVFELTIKNCVLPFS